MESGNYPKYFRTLKIFLLDTKLHNQFMNRIEEKLTVYLYIAVM